MIITGISVLLDISMRWKRFYKFKPKKLILYGIAAGITLIVAGGLFLSSWLGRVVPIP
jgi:hypothetical protein